MLLELPGADLPPLKEPPSGKGPGVESRRLAGGNGRNLYPLGEGTLTCLIRRR